MHCLETQARVLGYEVDLSGPQPVISIPEDKCAAIVDALMLSTNLVNVKEFRTLAGRLVWASQLTPDIKPDLQRIYQLLAVAEARQLHNMCISSQRRKELNELAERFTSNKLVKIYCIHQHMALIKSSYYPKEVYLTTDASLRGFGGYYYPRGYPWKARWFHVSFSSSGWDRYRDKIIKDGDSLKSGDMCF